MSCPNYKHPLVHNGTSQLERLAPELRPDSVQLDDRDTKTLLNFAYEFGTLLTYFNPQNEEDGNWQCFFSGGALGLLSIITAIDLEAIDDKYCRVEFDFWESLRDATDEERDGIRQEKYQALIDCIYDLVAKIDTLCQALTVSPDLKEEVLSIIKEDITKAILDNSVKNALGQLIAYDKGNQSEGSEQLLEEKYSRFITAPSNDSACTDCWGIGGVDDFYCISPNDGFMESQDPDNCKENRKLRALFFVFFQALSKISRRASYYLDNELNNNSAQEPQVSLFLSFIFLFKRLLAQFNELTKTHLDFYYQQVLCMPAQPFTADQVYVCFELAKNFEHFKLSKTTLLDAQKDEAANSMRYALDNEIVVNKAAVESCDALYFKVNDEARLDQIYSINAIQENGIKSNVIKWEDFRDSNLDNIDKQEVGIAVSDPILNLKEGTRFIVMTLEVEEDLPTLAVDVNTLVNVYFSSDLAQDGWLAIGATTNRINLAAFGMPSNSSTGGLTSNVNYRLEDGNVIVLNDYETNLNNSGFYVRFMNAREIQIRVLIKDNNFPISIPDLDDPFFKELKFPAMKLTFDDKMRDFLQVVNVHNIRIVTESVGVKTGLTIKNRLGTFNNKDTVSLMGNPAGSPETPLRSGAFVEFELDELKGKQLLGLEPSMNYLEFVPATSTTPATPEAAVTPTPVALITTTDTTTTTRFTPSFKLIDEFAQYADSSAAAEFPQLSGSYNTHEVQLDSILTLPIPTTRILGNVTDLTTGREPVNNPGFGIQNIQGFQQPPVGNTVTPNVSQSTNIVELGSTINPVADFSNNSLFSSPAVNPYSFNVFPANFNGGPGINFFQPPVVNNFPCIEYSALRNQNVLSLEYKSNADDYFNPAPRLVKGASFRYSSFSEFMFEQEGVMWMKNEFDRFYITPQGYNYINPATFMEATPLLPQYHILPADTIANEVLNVEDGAISAIAHLHIGIKDLEAGQQLSLLVIVEEGTGNTNFDPPEVRWEFLAKDENGVSDEWRSFQAGAIFMDTTKTDPLSKTSLLQTGIIKFTTSPEMTNEGTTIQPGSGLSWIRASLIARAERDERIVALPNIISICAQAEVATFVDNNNTLNHLGIGILPDTITKLVNGVPAIQTVKQTMGSFNGRTAEQPDQYYRRVSERLRHKNRAINIWDYERLILEAFPEVFHAKTISHATRHCAIEPGKVMTVIFPNLKNRTDINPFTPGLGIGKLEAIEDYLRERSNLFLFCDENIQVVNPLYELLQVRCCVRFKQGFSPAFYATQLNNDIHGFLAPWTVDYQSALLFSGELHSSTIINFIEEREYVDVVTNFEVCQFTIDIESGDLISVHGYDIEGNPLPSNREMITAATSRSLLTTFPAGHKISLFGEEDCNECIAPDFTNFQICND